MRKILALKFISFLMLALSAQASVSLKNGNFFISNTDILYPGGLEAKMERVYNSKTSFSGFFGPGWGNEYEVSLVVSADGSIVVKEYGGGAENRFTPTNFKKQDLDKAVDQIATAAKKMGGVGTGSQLNEYKSKLRNDASFRNKEWEKLQARGVLPAINVPIGTQFQSNRFSYQYITRTKEGYLRVFDNGRQETFDENGNVTRITDKNKNHISFKYRKDGTLESLVDNFNRKMFFTFNNKRLLEKIEGENGKIAKYGYNGDGLLGESKDVDGNVYRYKYDKRNNLTEIEVVNDKTKMVMTYYGPEQKDSIKSVKEQDGTLTEYSFSGDGKDYLKVGVLVKSSDGKTVSNSVYEYTNKRKADGEEWTYKLVSTVDGEKTETVYHEKFGLPTQIKRGSDVTSFEYNSRGNVVKKMSANEITELKYDNKVNKVNYVLKYPKSSPAKKRWSSFQYDSVTTNLTFAKNSEGKTVRLVYDTNGRIKSLIDQAKRRIDFKYNEASKPIEIRDPQLGAITVQYNNTGEVKSVDSTAGRRIAYQVTSAFQNLLDIIRPAGVTLSF